MPTYTEEYGDFYFWKIMLIINSNNMTKHIYHGDLRWYSEDVPFQILQI